jgi:hypothetical protein
MNATPTLTTGFVFFDVKPFLPADVIGVVSLVVLPLAVWARYFHRPAGRWRRTYVIAAMAAQYRNVFVLVVQSFLKVRALKAFAPTQAAPPSATHLVFLVLLIVLSIVAVLRFRDEPTLAITPLVPERKFQ